MKDIYSLIMYENATLPEKKFNKQTGKETCVPLFSLFSFVLPKFPFVASLLL